MPAIFADTAIVLDVKRSWKYVFSRYFDLYAVTWNLSAVILIYPL
ncbi:hypothetical protein [Cytobacillus gottheilii]|nr:hypothetical protein [Cytobacillus gottheilii]